MDERAFYNESNTSREAELHCPHCHTAATYGLTWILRKKKDRLPARADERDRARFAKAQSYMVLIDDKVMCANVQCRKRFDVSGIKTMAFLSPEQEAAIAAAPPRSQQRPEQRQNQNRPKGKPRRRGNQPERQSKQGGRGDQQARRDKQPGGRGDQQPGQKKDRRGDQQPDEQAGQQYDWRVDHFGIQPQQGRKGGKKKKRPQIYFPSDYVNYRP